MKKKESQGPDTVLFTDGPLAGKTARELLVLSFGAQTDMVSKMPGPPPMEDGVGWTDDDFANAFIHASFIAVVLQEMVNRWMDFIESIGSKVSSESIEALGPEGAKTLLVLQNFMEYREAEASGDEEQAAIYREKMEGHLVNEMFSSMESYLKEESGK